MPDSEQTLRNLIYCYMKKHFKLLMDTAQFHAEINGRKRACPECEQPATNGSDDIMFKEGVLGMLCLVDSCKEFSSLDDWNKPA
ncbi:hypothetical protein BC567DRAFT_263857 [Phyllosticta citribraziliensis]